MRLFNSINVNSMSFTLTFLAAIVRPMMNKLWLKTSPVFINTILVSVDDEEDTWSS